MGNEILVHDKCKTLDRAIATWHQAKNRNNFVKAVNALGPDAMCGKTVYISENPIGHFLEDGEHRMYVAHLEMNTLKPPAELGFVVIRLFDLLLMILDDENAVGLTIASIGRSNFFIHKEAIASIVNDRNDSR